MTKAEQVRMVMDVALLTPVAGWSVTAWVDTTDGYQYRYRFFVYFN